MEKIDTKAVQKQVKQRRARTLATIVCDAIEEMIISGQLSAGQRINESKLAIHLDVSRGPIREACRSLTQAGLLVAKVNHGFYVREMSVSEVRNLYEVRGALAGLMGRLVATRASKDDLQYFSQLIEKMDDAVTHQDVGRYFTVNLKFHDALLKAADNSSLAQNYRGVINQIILFRRRGLLQQGSLEVSNQEHKEILAGLIAGDADASEQAMRNHVARGWDRMTVSVTE